MVTLVGVIAGTKCAETADPTVGPPGATTKDNQRQNRDRGYTAGNGGRTYVARQETRWAGDAMGGHPQADPLAGPIPVVDGAHASIVAA